MTGLGKQSSPNGNPLALTAGKSYTGRIVLAGDLAAAPIEVSLSVIEEVYRVWP